MLTPRFLTGAGSGFLSVSVSGRQPLAVIARIVDKGWGSLVFCFINLFYLFIYYWLRWVFVAVRGLIAGASLVAEHGL